MKHNLEQSSLKTGNGRNMLVLLAASALAFSSSVSRGQVRNKPSLSQGTSAMYAVPPRGQQSNERSINLGSQPISVAFANQTNENLVAHWIDLNGVGQEIGLLVPGQVAEITTFPGHVTIFSSGSRRVATFRASTSSQPAYAILGPGGNTANMGPVTQFNPSVTGNQISSSATGITLSDIGRFFRELANKQSSAPGGGSTPGTNIGGNPGTNIGGNPGTNIGGTPGTNIGGNPGTNIGGKPGTNIGGTPGTNIGGNPGTNIGGNSGTNTGGNAIASTGSNLTPQAAQDLVNFHNRVRNDVGVGPVTWDATIAKFAQDYANKLATTIKQLQHNPNRVLNGVTLGENLSWGSAGSWTVLQLADQWESQEKNLWTPGSVIPSGSNPAGHYTQIIWRNSTKIGAGIATGPSGTYLVCNYSPAGNFIGQKPN